MKVDSQDHDLNMRKSKGLRPNKKIANGALSCEVLKGCSNFAVAKKTLHTSLVASENEAGDLQVKNKVPTFAKDMSLRKCESTPRKICCVFCQSSEDNKVSGKMMHYSGGRPVGPDYNGGVSIIHAHRNCAEWSQRFLIDATSI